MAGKIRNCFRLEDRTPDDLVRITWGILVVSAPFMAIALYRQPVINWAMFGAVGLWAFTISNAYLHRMYWRNHEMMVRNQQEMLNQIEYAYHLLHEHCPNCGARLRSPAEARQ